MTTPTPRTDAVALDRNDSHRHPDCSDRIVGWTDYDALLRRSRSIERDLAARDAELAAMKEKVKAAARDAGRYRWLRDRWYIAGASFPIPVSEEVSIASRFDDAIDYAIAPKDGGNG